MISALQCHPAVPPTSAQQCPGVPPTSAHKCSAVSPISAPHKCHPSVLPSQ
ncbi:unnamed protein product, partial [Staurois parvus]